MEGETFGQHARYFIQVNRADEIFHEAMLDASPISTVPSWRL